MNPLQVTIASMPGPGWWDWLGWAVQLLVAGGAIGAALVALRISGRDIHEREDERKRIAHVLQSVITPELDRLCAATINIAFALDALTPSGGVLRTGDPVGNPHELLASQCGFLRIPACENAMERLHALPEHRMRAIAALIGLLPNLCMWCENAGRHMGNPILHLISIEEAQAALGRVAQCFCQFYGIGPTDMKVTRLHRAINFAMKKDEEERIRAAQSS
jgi:hypothetical protein